MSNTILKWRVMINQGLVKADLRTSVVNYHIGDIDTDDDHSIKREFSIEDDFVPFSDDNGSDVVIVRNKVLAQN